MFLSSESRSLWDGLGDPILESYRLSNKLEPMTYAWYDIPCIYHQETAGCYIRLFLFQSIIHIKTLLKHEMTL
jgi:hypothetical protein